MPPRKPSSNRSTRGDDPLNLEHKRLLEQQEELLRQQERARRLIEEAPRRLEQLKKKQREPIRITLNAARSGQKTFGVPHDKFRPAASAPSRPRARKSERNMAKFQFVVSIVILAIIVIMILRSIPST